MKMATICSVYDVPIIPHGSSVPVNVHISAALSPTLCPYVEYLIKWNDIRQLHLKHRVQPVNGHIGPTNTPRPRPRNRRVHRNRPAGAHLAVGGARVPGAVDSASATNPLL